MTLKGQTGDSNSLRAQYFENYLSYRLQNWCAALYGECRAGTQIIFPESGRGLGYVAPTISIHIVGVRWPEKVCGISNGHATDDVT